MTSDTPDPMTGHRSPTGDFSDRVALVTGSSRGIGAAIARLLARRGARVAVHGRDREAIDAVVGTIEAEGGLALGVAADVTVFDEMEAARRIVEARLGPIDVLVANAGANLTPPGQVLDDLDEAEWASEVGLNLTGTFLTLKSVLPGMKERRRGSLVIVSSAAARRPSARSPIPYSASKAGIEVMARILAAQVGPLGIRVNCVAPETILTERNEERIAAGIRDDLAASHPIQRLGTPEDVAHAVAFLASEQAAWISGVTIDVAGGAVFG